jgi:hypothetical protein
MIKLAPAFHRMKHIYAVLINDIIQYFQQVTIAVKSKQQMLIRYFLKYVIIQKINNRMANIIPAEPMPERGIVELNEDFHTLILAHNAMRGNAVRLFPSNPAPSRLRSRARDRRLVSRQSKYFRR